MVSTVIDASGAAETVRSEVAVSSIATGDASSNTDTERTALKQTQDEAASQMMQEAVVTEHSSKSSHKHVDEDSKSTSSKKSTKDDEGYHPISSLLHAITGKK